MTVSRDRSSERVLFFLKILLLCDLEILDSYALHILVFKKAFGFHLFNFLSCSLKVLRYHW
jgi:hypothetical protein